MPADPPHNSKTRSRSGSEPTGGKKFRVKTSGPTRRGPLIDAGWLFLIAGLTLMAGVVLIPAQHDLALATWMRDRVLTAEMHRLDRLTRHEMYLDAVRRRDETVLRQLAVRQLGLAPADAEVILLNDFGGDTNASVFHSLEPDRLRLPSGPSIGTTLGRLATDERARLWMLAAASLLVLIGLLPSSVQPDRTEG